MYWEAIRDGETMTFRSRMRMIYEQTQAQPLWLGLGLFLAIFFPCGLATADVAFSFVHIQNLPNLAIQSGMELRQAVGQIFVNCGF